VLKLFFFILTQSFREKKHKMFEKYLFLAAIVRGIIINVDSDAVLGGGSATVTCSFNIGANETIETVTWL